MYWWLTHCDHVVFCVHATLSVCVACILLLVTYTCMILLPQMSSYLLLIHTFLYLCIPLFIIKINKNLYLWHVTCLSNFLHFLSHMPLNSLHFIVSSPRSGLVVGRVSTSFPQKITTPGKTKLKVEVGHHPHRVKVKLRAVLLYIYFFFIRFQIFILIYIRYLFG